METTKGYSDSDLILYRKTEELLDFVFPIIKNFPKYETMGLRLSIDNTFYTILSLISRANRVKSLRLKLAQEADGYLSHLNILFRQVVRRQYISFDQYDTIEIRLSEIGKLLSGYIKAASKT